MTAHITFLDDVQSKDLVPVEAPKAANNLIAQEQNILYFSIQQLKTAWQHVYERYIFKTLYEKISPDEAVRRLNDVIMALDGAMIHLSAVGKDREEVLKHLERLKKLLGMLREKNQISDASKNAVRRAAQKATVCFDRMATKVACPAPVQRFFRSLWGEIKLDINENDRQRLKTLAASYFESLSRDIATGLNIDEEIVAAFKELGLGVWATRQEMEEQYKYLARQFHPDHNTDTDGTRMQGINNARGVLLAKHF